MNRIFQQGEYEIFLLTPELAQKYMSEICRSLDQIPSVEKHDAQLILSLKKGDRHLWKKWEHSCIALTRQGHYVGILIGYEREAEGNEQYPVPSIYLSDLAVDSQFQRKGLGKLLVKVWLEYNRTVGFLHLTGDIVFSVQTNSDISNAHVQKLYESFGFQKIAEKMYDNRKDNVYFLRDSS